MISLPVLFHWSQVWLSHTRHYNYVTQFKGVLSLSTIANINARYYLVCCDCWTIFLRYVFSLRARARMHNRLYQRTNYVKRKRTTSVLKKVLSQIAHMMWAFAIMLRLKFYVQLPKRHSNRTRKAELESFVMHTIWCAVDVELALIETTTTKKKKNQRRCRYANKIVKIYG